MKPATGSRFWIIACLCGSALWLRAQAPGTEPFDYFQNSWNVIGLKDYQDGTRLTPRNELLLSGGRKLRLSCGARPVPLGKAAKTLLEGWLPIVQLSAEQDGIQYQFTLWATPLPDVKNWQAAFDWPTEGDNYLNWIQVKAVNRSARQTLAQVTLDLPATRELIGQWRQSLLPGQSSATAFRVPFSPVNNPGAYDSAEPQVWLDRTAEYWRGVLARGARIEVPCPKALQAFRAALVCQLIANDHGVLHAGEGFYDEFYIRDGGYQLLQYLEAGLWEPARKAAEAYLPAQRADGRFESQRDQFDANGQALWVLWNYWKMTRDDRWLRDAYPHMRRAVDWIQRARRQDPENSASAGLLPPAPADGEYLWDGKHHIVGYDFWNLRGVLCTADAARQLGLLDEADALEREARDYRQAIDAAWRRTGLPHFPPSWEKDGTHWGNTETLWPTELFEPTDPRVTALLSEVRERHGGGFVEGTIRWTGQPNVIHPYMSAYTSLASLSRGEHERFVEEFYWYLLHSSASHAFPEGVYFKRRYAWSETIPHALGAANFAILLRHALVHEQGNDLHLLPGIPDWWLEAGKEIRIEKAPTHFGPLQLRIRGKENGIEAVFDPPRRNPPTRIILHLPDSRPLLTPLSQATVVVRRAQSRRWDFPAIVQAYRNLPVAQVKPIAGLVALPLADAPAADHCVFLDLSSRANTDPFSAPFGVPRPGKLLFTGLATGLQTVAGVPFRIIDPAQNHGKGLVVLEGAQACQQFPIRVEIPVQRSGKRLFLLGNVHGWSPDDEGAGESGAIAEYQIHYADGQTQTIPLISHRTTDDWATEPDASEVLPALRGDPWHLNVLAVALRPALIDRITFRDLGTPAAPVLAAATLEQ